MITHITLRSMRKKHRIESVYGSFFEYSELKPNQKNKTKTLNCFLEFGFKSEYSKHKPCTDSIGSLSPFIC